MVLSEGRSFTGLMREVGMKPEAYPEDTRTFVICKCVLARDGKNLMRSKAASATVNFGVD
jgi:hypothetical protein